MPTLRIPVSVAVGWSTGMFCLLIMGAMGSASPAMGQPLDSTLTIVEAVRTTVQQNPTLQQRRAAVSRREGQVAVARSAFDTDVTLQTRVSRERTPLTQLQEQQYPGVSEQVTDVYSTRLSAERTLGTGLVIQPSVSLNRTALGVAGDSPPAALSELPNNNSAEVGITLTQPLLKGRGAAAARAKVNVAAATLEATEASWRQSVAKTVLGTVVTYWQYVAARERHRIAQASEERVERLLKETKTLVESDQRPAAELIQLRADRADKRAARIRAEKAVFEARTELGRAMGISARRSARLSPPSDSMPSLAEGTLTDSLPSADTLQTYAVRHRPDVTAAQKRAAAAKEWLTAAQRNQLHALDLSVGVGYTGITEGKSAGAYVDPLAQNVGGTNLQVGLQYELPIANREAKGTLVKRRASYKQRRVAQEQAARRARLDVQQARQDVAAGRNELQQTRTAVRYHRRALENERQKRQQGISTLFTVLLFEERLTRALRNHIDARRRLAVALANLNYALGRFSAPAIVGAQSSLTRTDFIDVPETPSDGL